MRTFLVQIEASNADGTNWQAVHPADTVRTDGDNDVYDTADVTDGATELARDAWNNQNVVDGAGRVVVWDADTTSDEPVVIYYGPDDRG